MPRNRKTTKSPSADLVRAAVLRTEGRTGIELSVTQMEGLLRRSGIGARLTASGRLDPQDSDDIATALCMELMGNEPDGSRQSVLYTAALNAGYGISIDALVSMAG